jgi:hypothetical protein
MLNAPSLSPRENELVQREIQEIRDALEAFKAAVEAGEVTGFKTAGCGHITVSDNLLWGVNNERKAQREGTIIPWSNFTNSSRTRPALDG